MKNIYYIGGSPCSGKSTIAKMLAEDCGLFYFKTDDFLEKYIALGAKKGYEICQKQSELSPEQIFMRDADLQCREELQFYEEIFDMIREDIEAVSDQRDIIAEGAAFLPALMKRNKIAENRYICITPTASFQIEHYKKREWISYILEGCPDKEKAFDNWMNRDILFAEEARKQCTEAGYQSIVTDGKTAVDDVFLMVCSHFGLKGDVSQDYLDLKSWLEETKEEPLESMDAFFDVRIDSYEEHMSPWHQHYLWLAKLLPEKTETLLDIGCGSGLELDRIFERFPNLHVTGVDLSEEMLGRLKKKHGSRALTLIRDDYFVHEFGENRFDAVVSFETLHHFTAEKKRALFEKICRCLKPGGIYLECDYIAKTKEVEDLCFEECRRRRERDGIPPETFVHFDTPLTLAHEMQAMEEAGFSKVELVGFLPEDDHTAMIRAVK